MGIPGSKDIHGRYRSAENVLYGGAGNIRRRMTVFTDSC
jgi:fructose-1,6-bisphosphatase